MHLTRVLLLSCVLVTGASSALWSQEAAGQAGYSVGGEGGSEGGSMPQGQGELEIRHADGTTETGTYLTVLKYYLAPGWAKPRRMSGGGAFSGPGYANFAIRSGQSKQPGMQSPAGASGPVMGGAMGGDPGSTLPAGGLTIDAVIAPKAEGDKHAKVIVGRLQRSGGMGMGGMAGMGSEGAGGMMGSMGGYGDMGGGMAGGMEGMMDGGMGMGEMSMGPLVITPLEETNIAKRGPAKGQPQFSTPQLKNLAELVRVDCWIEEELETLRSARRGNADKFAGAESSLKELLSQEYRLQLDKQREDIQRLSEKLKALEGELARRASAQERVVDVQLGQLVLEAQGLLGERP